MRFVLLSISLCLSLVGLFGFNHSFAMDDNWTVSSDETVFPFEKVLADGEEAQIATTSGASIDLREVLRNDVVESNVPGAANKGSYFKQLLILFQIDGFTAETKGDGAVVYSEKRAGISFLFNILNIIIALSAFVAVGFLIYGFYGIFFANDDEGYSKARTITINTAIALAIIALSYFVTSMSMYIYRTVVN